MTLTRTTAMGLNGAITTSHYLASMAGLRILEDGGNALDACIAANAVLGVVRPFHCGIGGDLFVLIRPPGADRPVVLNASGRAGSKATPELVRAAGHERMPDRGPLSVVAPGCVHGWQMALDRFGTRELAALLAPAIEHAERGFPVYPRFIEVVAENSARLNEAARAVFAPGGAIPRRGDVVRQPDMAHTLGLIAKDGPRVMYAGPIGRAIGEFLSASGGHLTPEDIAAHRSEWAEPVEGLFRGYRVYAPPPNSHALLHPLSLGLLDPLDLGEPGSAHATHVQLEAVKIAYRDRPAIADPAFISVPVAELLSAEHIEAGLKELSLQRATAPGIAGAEDTVYLCATDRDGMAVSMIQSLRQPFGSRLMAPGTGVMLNDRALDFGIQEDDPNCIAPGKRPRHTLSPAMAFTDRGPAFVYGTSGGGGQPYTMVQLSCNLMAFGMDPQEAVEAPRWCIDPREADPRAGKLGLEARFSDECRAGLAALGHPMATFDDFDDVCGTSAAIHIDQDRGVLLAGADPRGDGVALAY